MAACNGCHWDPVMRIWRTSINCPLHGKPRGKDPLVKWELTLADRTFLRQMRIAIEEE